jgi:hypothetical protein
MQRVVVPLLFVLGLVCFGLGAWGYYQAAYPGTLVIDNAERVLSNVEPGKDHVVTFTLRNTSRVPIRIVGLAMC